MDRARQLGQLDELVGGEETELGVVPPHQRLDPHDGAGPEVDERLEVQLELTLVEGGAEVAEHAHTADEDRSRSAW